jgi:hypothetical protein
LAAPGWVEDPAGGSIGAASRRLWISTAAARSAGSAFIACGVGESAAPVLSSVGLPGAKKSGVVLPCANPYPERVDRRLALELLRRPEPPPPRQTGPIPSAMLIGSLKGRPQALHLAMIFPFVLKRGMG